MSKPNGKAARLSSGAGSTKGRLTSATKPALRSDPTGRTTAMELKTQTNRGISAGGGVKRGDQRDRHPSFSTGKVSRDGGRSGPLGASGRKRGPKSGGAGGGTD